MKLNINEIFGPTVQGEGKNAGKPVIFLRMAGCNLHCIWCDTPHTWNWVGTDFEHPDKYEKEKEVHPMQVESVYQRINELAGEIRSLVVSGGEPLIQQKTLVALFALLKQDGWYIEVETNGTVTPMPQVFEFVDQVNCSPKLSNSKDPRKLRFKAKALKVLAAHPKVNFKFVVDSAVDMSDVFEYVDFIRKFGNPEIRLMPMSTTKDELLSREPEVKALCRSYDFIYCTRLSILMAGTERGV